MTQLVRKKRFHLSLVAEQTRRMLFFLLVFIGVSLFITQLFLMNNLAMRGYALTLESQRLASLSEQQERLDIQIAKLQTQESVNKPPPRGNFGGQGKNKSFVVVPVRYTAQN